MPILTTSSEAVQREMWRVIDAAQAIACSYNEIDHWLTPSATVRLGLCQDLELAIGDLKAALANEHATIEAFTGGDC